MSRQSELAFDDCPVAPTPGPIAQEWVTLLFHQDQLGNLCRFPEILSALTVEPSTQFSERWCKHREALVCTQPSAPPVTGHQVRNRRGGLLIYPPRAPLAAGIQSTAK